MLDALKLLYLACVLLFLDFYIINPSYRFILASNVLLVGWYLCIALDSASRKKPRRESQAQNGSPREGHLSKETWHVLIAAFVFMTYVFIDDLVHDETLRVAGIRYAGSLLIVLLLPSFEKQGDTFPLLRSFTILMSFSVIFGLFQFMGSNANLGTLLPNLGLLRSDNSIMLTSNWGGRVGGAIASVIGFSEQLSILLLFLYLRMLRTYNPLYLLALAPAGLVLLATQVRTAVIGLVLCVLVTQVLSKKKLLTGLMQAALVVAVMGICYLAINEWVFERFGYLTKQVDTGDTHRFTTNYIMAQAVLEESPFLGIAREDAWDLYFEYKDRSAANYDPTQTETPTHHNQLGYFLRYYGLIGLFLLACLYFTVYRRIRSSPCRWIRVFLYGVFLLDFTNSLAHNNKLTSTPLLWVLLSLAALDAEKGNEAL